MEIIDKLTSGNKRLLSRIPKIGHKPFYLCGTKMNEKLMNPRRWQELKDERLK